MCRDSWSTAYRRARSQEQAFINTLGSCEEVNIKIVVVSRGYIRDGKMSALILELQGFCLIHLA